MKNHFYDLHCDTATTAYFRKTSLEDKNLHINKKALSAFEKAVQVFAFFYNDKRTDPGMEFFFSVKNFIEKETSGEKELTPIFSCEGGNITDGKLDNIHVLAENKVKFFSLVWNGVSHFATGQSTDPNEGLTPLGKDCVKELERNGIIIDVSHISDKGFADIEKIATKTFVATHSNSRAVCNHGRNLTDDQIKIIVERRGLIGLNLNPPFLNSGSTASYEDILKHTEKILKLGGESTLSLGCDLDGIDSLPKGFSDVSSLSDLRDFLLRELGTELTEKIFYGNAEAFFNKYIY